MHYFDPEMGGGGICPELHGICGGECPWEVFSARAAHNLDFKTVELSAKRMAQGRWGFIQVKKEPSLSVSVAKCSEHSVVTMYF